MEAEEWNHIQHNIKISMFLIPEQPKDIDNDGEAVCFDTCARLLPIYDPNFSIG